MPCISDEPPCTMKVIHAKFKLKGDKIGEPDMYLGSELSKMTTTDDQECWAMYFDKYCTTAVTNVESVFGKVCFKVSTKLCYPYKLWLLSRYGCDWRVQGKWIPNCTKNWLGLLVGYWKLVGYTSYLKYH